MATPREHFDRLVKAKKLLKADADALTDLRSTRDQREGDFKKALQRLTDFMKSNKKAVVNGKSSTLKEQLARKDRDPKLATAVKFAKDEIEAYDKFCSGTASAGAEEAGDRLLVEHLRIQRRGRRVLTSARAFAGSLSRGRADASRFPSGSAAALRP